MAATETVTFGEGDWRYEWVPSWGLLPDGVTMGEVAAVAVDDRDNVYVFNRGPDPMLVFDADGTFLRNWGQGIFSRPHGLHFAPDRCLYCTDMGDQTVRKCTLDGEVLLTIGVPGRPAPFMSGQPFHRCTHSAITPDGQILVSDGYGNGCVHRFSPDGRHLSSWGQCGTGEGEFNLPHAINCDDDGWIYVADRENHRIQIFDSSGRYETAWHCTHRPMSLAFVRCCCPACIVAEAGPELGINRTFPNLGPRLQVLSMEGKPLARIGTAPAGDAPDAFVAPHGIAVDSTGAIYVGEVTHSAWPMLFPGQVPPKDVAVLRKLRRLISDGKRSEQDERADTGGIGASHPSP